MAKPKRHLKPVEPEDDFGLGWAFDDKPEEQAEKPRTEKLVPVETEAPSHDDDDHAFDAGLDHDIVDLEPEEPIVVRTKRRKRGSGLRAFSFYVVVFVVVALTTAAVLIALT